MKRITKNLATATCGLLISGCIVREERPRHVYYYGPPPAPVEIIPGPPEPAMIWVGGVYVHEGDNWRWHHGYWRR